MVPFWWDFDCKIAGRMWQMTLLKKKSALTKFAGDSSCYVTWITSNKKKLSYKYEGTPEAVGLDRDGLRDDMIKNRVTYY